MARTEDKIKAGAKGLLEPGEEILAAACARPRGWTQANARAGVDGAVSGAMGAKKMGGHVEAAREAGFELGSPMALAATNRRLLSIQISNPVGFGIGLKVKHLIAAVPLAEVDAIESKRLAAGKVLTATVRGVPFKLEIGAGGNVDGILEAHARARSELVSPNGR
ncbi:MAG TPA: hypothetical protein VF081_14595 [Solirubrobacterales bacterium]